MTPLTQEWVDKAEGDFDTTQRERRARKNVNHDAACFHAQQCAEKYLKARLQEANIAFPFTHDLMTLLNLLSPIQPGWVTLSSDLQLLSNFAVGFRYPGHDATLADARDAFKACKVVRATVRLSLGLP